MSAPDLDSTGSGDQATAAPAGLRSSRPWSRQRAAWATAGAAALLVAGIAALLLRPDAESSEDAVVPTRAEIELPETTFDEPRKIEPIRLRSTADGVIVDVADGRAWIAAEDSIEVLDLSTAQSTMLPLPGGRVTGLGGASPDLGSIWFTGSDETSENGRLFAVDVETLQVSSYDVALPPVVDFTFVDGSHLLLDLLVGAEAPPRSALVDTSGTVIEEFEGTVDSGSSTYIADAVLVDGHLWTVWSDGRVVRRSLADGSDEELLEPTDESARTTFPVEVTPELLAVGDRVLIASAAVDIAPDSGAVRDTFTVVTEFDGTVRQVIRIDDSDQCALEQRNGEAFALCFVSQLGSAASSDGSPVSWWKIGPDGEKTLVDDAVLPNDSLAYVQPRGVGRGDRPWPIRLSEANARSGVVVAVRKNTIVRYELAVDQPNASSFLGITCVDGVIEGGNSGFWFYPYSG